MIRLFHLRRGAACCAPARQGFNIGGLEEAVHMMIPKTIFVSTLPR
jgi:hypothetical protein